MAYAPSVSSSCHNGGDGGIPLSRLLSVQVSGSVLTWARTSVGIPLDKAAERLDLSPQELASREASGGTFGLAELEHMSTVYRRPVAALLFSAPPVEPPLPTDHRTVRAQGQFPLSTPTILAVRFAQRVQELAEDVARLAGDETGTRLPSASLSDDPDAVARRLREALGVSLATQSAWRGEYDPLNGWTSAAEALGVYVLRQKMPWEETRAFVLAGLPAVVVLNSEDSPNGRVFSLLHELCHLMLSSASVCDMRFKGYDSASESVEVFCNRCAGTALVPERVLLSEVSGRREDPSWTDSELRTLARKFGVSQEVVLRRLLIVGKTDGEFYSRWREQDEERYAAYRANRNKDGWQPIAPRTVQENGHLFTRQVLRAEGSQALSSAEAAQYLNVGTKHLDKMRGLLP